MADTAAALVIQLSADVKSFQKEMERAVGINDKASRDIIKRNKELQSGLAGGFKEASSQMQAQLGGLASKLGPLGEIVGAMGVGWLGAAAGVAVAVDVMKQAAEAAEADRIAFERINAVLKASGDASGVTAQQIEQLGTSISESTNFARKDIIDAAGELATFQNVGKEAFGQVMQLAVDMSATFGTDLKSSVELLGRAFDDPIDGMTRLKRAHIDLTPAQIAVIENLQRSGNLMAAQNALLDDLKTHFNGVAEAMHTGITGATNDLTNAWDRLLIALGNTSGVGGIATDVIRGLSIVIEKATSGYNLFLANLHQGADNAIGRRLLPGDTVTTNQQPGDDTGQSGPAALRARQLADLHKAIADQVKELADDVASGAPGSLNRYVNDHLETIAKQQHLTLDALKRLDPKGVADLSAKLAQDFNAKQQRGGGAGPDLKAEADARRLNLDRLNVDQAKAIQAMVAANDQMNADLAKGSGAYYAALTVEITDERDLKIKTITQEAQAEIDKLNRLKGLNEADYSNRVNIIENTASARRLAAEDEAKAALRAADAERQYTDAMVSSREEIAKSSSNSLELTNTLRDGLENVAAAGVTGFKSMGDAAVQLVEQLAQMALKLYVLEPLLKGIFPGGAGSGSGSLLGSLFGLGGAGSGAAGDVGQVVSLGARASGGPVSAGTPYIVGEHRPELFVPGVSGMIVPSVPQVSSGGGSRNVTMRLETTVNLAGANGDAAINAASRAAALTGAQIAMTQVKANFASMMQESQARFL